MVYISIVILQFLAVRFSEGMEGDNAVKTNEEIHAEAPVVAPEKEEKNATNGETPLKAKKTSEHVAKTEGLNSSGIASGGAANVSERKLSNTSKVPCNLWLLDS